MVLLHEGLLSYRETETVELCFVTRCASRRAVKQWGIGPVSPPWPSSVTGQRMRTDSVKCPASYRYFKEKLLNSESIRCTATAVRSMSWLS